MSRSDYDAHMDALVKKVGAVFDGEDALDAASVAAVCCAWGIYTGTTTLNARQRALEAIIKFIRSELKKMEDSEDSGTLWEKKFH